MNLLNTEETYSTLQPFKSLAELNSNTRLVREKFGSQLSKSTLIVLDTLARYSCKYYGLSYRSKNKIAAELNLSRRTVIRACNLLESLGVIKQYELKRHNGDQRQSSNAIVFIPLKKEVTPPCHTVNTLLNTKNINNTKDTENQVDLLKKGLAAKMPKRIGTALSAFFTASEMYEAYRVMLRAKASIDRNIMFEHHENDYYDTFLSVMNANKRGKIHKSLFGTLYVAIKATSKRIYIEQQFNAAFEA